MRAVLDGRLRERRGRGRRGPRLAQRAERMAARSTLRRRSTGSQMLTLLAERGGLGGLAPQLEEMVREIGSLPGWRATLAWAHLQAGRAELARARARSAQRRRLRDLPARRQLPPVARSGGARARRSCGDAGLAAIAEPLLRAARRGLGHLRDLRGDPGPGRVLARRCCSSCRTGRTMRSALRAGPRAILAHARAALRRPLAGRPGGRAAPPRGGRRRGARPAAHRAGRRRRARAGDDAAASASWGSSAAPE